MTVPLAADGRGVIVAVDQPLYSWPCRGLEEREALRAPSSPRAQTP